MTFHNRRRRCRHHHDHHDHRHHHHRHHHHHLANMQFCHLLTRFGLTGPQVSLTVSPGIFRLSVCNFFCIPDNLLDSVLLTCYNLFFFPYSYILSTTGVIFSTFAVSVCFIICERVSRCLSHVFNLCCCYSSRVFCFNVQSFTTV